MQKLHDLICQKTIESIEKSKSVETMIISIVHKIFFGQVQNWSVLLKFSVKTYLSPTDNQPHKQPILWSAFFEEFLTLLIYVSFNLSIVANRCVQVWMQRIPFVCLIKHFPEGRKVIILSLGNLDSNLGMALVTPQPERRNYSMNL